MILNFEKTAEYEYFCKDFNLLAYLSDFHGSYIDSYNGWIMSDAYIDISEGFGECPLFSVVPQLFGSTAQSLYSNFLDHFSGISSFFEFSFIDSLHVVFRLKSSLPDNFSVSLPSDSLGFQSLTVKTVSDFNTDLYPELLDNEETKLSLQRWINDGSPSWDTYSDKDIKAMELIEKYNKNVLLLRSTRKVEIDKEISLSSDSSSDVDLTPVVQQLSNINNKLQTTEQIDNTQKSITDVLNQQANTIQVDEIGLLRSKKGYY